MRTEFRVKGFHCKSCEVLMKDVCSDFSEIKSCNVDLKSGKVIIGHDSSLDLAKLKKEIESLGEYKVVL